MQASFSHVGTGGARKTPPLSLGTWPTEGEGYEEALSWYDKVQRTLEPLRGKVGSDDERVQKIKLQCQQASGVVIPALLIHFWCFSMWRLLTQRGQPYLKQAISYSNAL